MPQGFAHPDNIPPFAEFIHASVICSHTRKTHGHMKCHAPWIGAGNTDINALISLIGQDIKQGLVQRGCNAAAVESHACINGGFTGPLISCTLAVR